MQDSFFTNTWAVKKYIDPRLCPHIDRGSNGIVCRLSSRRELMIGHRASHRQRRRRKSRVHIGINRQRENRAENRCAPKSSTQITPAAINEWLRSPHVESHCILERSSQTAAVQIS